MMGSCAEYEL
jgi:hypothetical protein